jgi:hypothetical protein
MIQLMGLNGLVQRKCENVRYKKEKKEKLHIIMTMGMY